MRPVELYGSALTHHLGMIKRIAGGASQGVRKWCKGFSLLSCVIPKQPPDTEGDGESSEDFREGHDRKDVNWTLEVCLDVTLNASRLCSVGSERSIVVGHTKDADLIDPSDFPEESPPSSAVRALREQGYVVMTGHWNQIPSNPPAILLDVTSVPNSQMEEVRKNLWDSYVIEIPDTDKETMEALVFGYLVSKLFIQFQLAFPTSLVCHNWQGALAMILLRREQVRPITCCLLISSLVLGNTTNLKKHGIVLAFERNCVHRFQFERTVLEFKDVTLATFSENLAQWISHQHRREVDYIIVPNDAELPEGARFVGSLMDVRF